MAVPFLLIVWTLIIEQAKKLCRTSQLLSLSLKREFMFLAVLVLDKRCTFWLSYNGIIFLCKHTVDKLSGLHALQSSHYKGDNIINARRLIRRVVLAEVKKNYFLAETNTCLISDKYQKPCVY